MGPTAVALGFEPEVRLNGAIDSLPPRIVTELLAVAREALSNIARHADCKCVSLNISVAHNLLVAEIRDDGRGFAGPQNAHAATNGRGGHGLENMRSRVAELGGHLSIDSTPGQGTLLKVSVPLKKP